jgi:hypothetical protein
MGKSKLFLLGNLLPIFLVVSYNEYFIYIHVISQCQWPKSSEPTMTKILLIADTHLLGSRNGHWFDKLRREWQQLRSYKTTIRIFKPNYAIILGDLTDEGKWCSNEEWQSYNDRTNAIFAPEFMDTKLFVLVGNHDVGFHYNMDKNKVERFNRSFTKQFISLEIISNNRYFVFVNSMALLNDNCEFCERAQSQLKQLNKTLNCIQAKNCKTFGFQNLTYGKPIVFTHFPLFRHSDSICPKDIDTEPIDKRSTFKQAYDCLSKKATKQVISCVY